MLANRQNSPIARPPHSPLDSSQPLRQLHNLTLNRNLLPLNRRPEISDIQIPRDTRAFLPSVLAPNDGHAGRHVEPGRDRPAVGGLCYRVVGVQGRDGERVCDFGVGGGCFGCYGGDFGGSDEGCVEVVGGLFCCVAGQELVDCGGDGFFFFGGHGWGLASADD